MKALILLILPAVLFAQLPKPGGGGGGGGSSTGSSNPSCTFASSATTCSIDVSSLNVTSANYKTILAECFTGASTTQTPVTITNYAYTTGSGIVQTVAPTFGAAAAAGYCAANGNGGAGPTGPAGGAGPTGSTGATGPGYGGTSTSAVSIGSGLKSFTTQAGLAYLVGVPIRATSAGAPTSYMQGTVDSYSGTTLVINVSTTGGVGTRADWNLSLIGLDGPAGPTGPTGPTGSGAAYAADTGTVNHIVIAPSPAITYTAGTAVLVKVANDSTGAVDINANGLGTKNVTTTLGAALYTDTFKAGGVYLLVYDGTQFQLQGTAACTQVSSGLSCGPGWITMRGNTGYRVYATETTGANDSVYIVGYLQGTVPTSGNCAQWSTDGGQPILGQAAAPCGSGGGGGSINTQLDGSVIGTGITALNFVTGNDVTPTVTQAGSVTSVQYAPVSTRWATRDQIQSGTDDYCSPVSGSSSAYTCTHAHPLAAYTDGQTQTMRFDVGGSGGAITVNMDSLGAKKIFGPDGTTALTTTQSAAGVQGLMIYDGAVDSGSGGWKFQTGGGTSTGGGTVYAADSGSANAITVTAAGFTYTAGSSIFIKMNASNTGATTATINGTSKNVKTMSIQDPPADALHAGGVYLLVYDGTQLQLEGTANCAMTSTGIACASVSSSSVTLGGSTSGQTTYVGPAVGASATYRLTGYSSATNPTAGNCMQWTSLSGNLVAGDAGSACGSGTAGIDMTTFSKTIIPAELGYDLRGIFYSALCDGGPSSWVSTAGEPGVGMAVSGAGNCFASWPSNSSNQHPMKDFASGGTPRNWTVVSRYAKAATTTTNTASDFYPILLNTVNSGTFATSLGIRWNHTSTNYECYIRSGGTDVVATTVAGTSDSLEHTFKIYNNGTANSLSCSVDGGTVTTVSGTVPTADWFISSGIVGLSGTTEFSFSEIRVLLTGLAR